MEYGQSAPRSDAEDFEIGGSVEVPVGALDRHGLRVVAVRASLLCAEAVERCQRAPRGHSEEGAKVRRPATVCCPVKVSIQGLHQPGLWAAPVTAARVVAEVIQRCQC